MKRYSIIYFILLFMPFTKVSASENSLDSSVLWAWDHKYEYADSAKNTLYQSLELAISDKNHQIEAKIYSFLGVMEDIAGNSDKAIELLLKAAKIQESYEYLKDLSFTYNNLGIANFFQFNHKQALIYYQKSLDIDKAINNENGIAGTLINMAVIYTYTDSIDKAKDMYEEAMKIYTLQNDSSGIASCLNNLGKLNYGNKNYSEAIKQYESALSYARNLKNIEIIFTSHYGLSSTYRKLNDLSKAIYFAEKATSLALNQNARERLQWGYDLLADLYESKKDFENAYRYRTKYSELKDSLMNEDKNSKIAEMQTLYETEKKDKQIAEIELEKQREESLRIAKEKERNFFLGTSFFIFLALGFVGYAYRSKQQKNILLQERNTAIQENLKHKETMIGEIHHRIKNNLQIISSIFDLQARNLTDESAIRAINDGQNRVKAMAIIHQKLYQQSDIYGIAMDDYIQNLASAIIDTFNMQENKIKLHFDIDDIHLHIDTSIPIGLIITEILTNAIKYAFPDGREGNILISLKLKNDNLELKITDNGVGFGNAVPDKNSTSFGIKMIKSLSRQLKSDWDVKNDNGACYLFRIKNYKLREQA
jgi:two-component system, sensor histidine kinase PdtaS